MELKISIDRETIWLTQKQIAILFEKDIRTINDHIKAIYKDKELYREATIRKFRIVQKEGNREVERGVLHYNLDMIISVGYRVNSKKATRFRQWATEVLKGYIYNGYTINSEKITHQRFKELEDNVSLLKEKIKLLERQNIKPRQGIFFEGQIFDAYKFINELIKTARNSIKLIDNYIDESVLSIFSKVSNIKVIIYTKSINKQLKLDLKKYKEQYSNIEIKKFEYSHDRFLIIDDKEIYHFGASLKDLGKKWFAFSKFDIDAVDILERLKKL